MRRQERGNDDDESCCGLGSCSPQTQSDFLTVQVAIQDYVQYTTSNIIFIFRACCKLIEGLGVIRV